MAYAFQTSVPVDRSKAEIERLLSRYGADQFVTGWELGRALVGFRCHNRFIRFLLAIPDRKEKAFTETQGKRYARTRSTESAQAAYDQEIRRRWRALALVIKAKLEAVETGITTFEDEFLAHIVMPDGHTVAEHITPKIEAAYKTGKMPRLLPMGDPAS